ncbi:cytochrome P450 [Dissoconium aciculare CBS 342.82]|jgi:cytochrome P450|uniref:Cytochrome P450 n=1 Tax=Dissoconium aciculare CBS 342.82 TaxID=1314786 RepID=A0A6J3M3X7_9PEZI|nr:cytochrome P450 [Dissoconium aciculare CBS 342.82]KAF1822189.1 cytochrome P450 [Dissoconium aciculare CBS 342.82]
MAVMMVSAVTIAIIAYAIYKFIIYPTFISPLSRIPAAHPTAHFSSLWILHHRLHQRDTLVVHDAHTRLGPIVRIAPNEVAINSVDGGIKTIYTGGFEKGEWYQIGFANYGVEPMFAMPDRKHHGVRKRLVSNVYAKSTLLGSAAIRGITSVVVRHRLRDRIRNDMRRCEREGGSVEFYDIFAAAALDFVSAYVFGVTNATNLLEDQKESVRFLREFKARQVYTFWRQECPLFTKFMSSLGLLWTIVPRWVDESSEKIERWNMRLCEAAEASCAIGETNHDHPECFPTVYAQLREGLIKVTAQSIGKSMTSVDQATRVEIAAELLDHTLAGLDTSSITLTYLAWEVSRPSNRHWQDLLRREVRNLPRQLRWDARALDGLPILHAIIMETLRLHAPIPGQQPRVTPTVSEGCSPTILCGHELPTGVRVQAQAWSLHRNKDVFPDPEAFEPRRWLPPGGNSLPVTSSTTPEHAKEMARWFWAFSSGGRMCVGSNLAMLDMKAIVAGIWSRFETTAISGDESMRHNGGYLAEPLGAGPGGYCRLQVRGLDDDKDDDDDDVKSQETAV